jgi:1,4-alpha-glucan branching enzyme
MQGYFSLVLHAHLPYVRHPEHPTFLEENWLYEAITETYLPLLQIMQGWLRDGMDTRVTITLTPTLCSMFDDPLLRERYMRYLDGLIDLAEKETHRTLWDPTLNPLAHMYYERFKTLRDCYRSLDGDLIGAFRALQQLGKIEIITCAATHAVLPLLKNHPPSIRAQIMAARDHYHRCFGCDPRGIWLPECAYSEEIEPALVEAKISWFIVETHGVLYADPRPRYGTYAPILTPNGLAVFGRDLPSAKQVWSRNEGYPGDPVYRDFYRDIGFDLDYDYLKPHMPAPPHRSFTGVKYFAITGANSDKRPYNKQVALQRAADHAGHFLQTRIAQIRELAAAMDRPPIIVSPYDAELFGHWWYEGPQFLDYFVRKLVYDQNVVALINPGEFLQQQRTHQIARPSASSWGEEGYWKVWLNDENAWMWPHLQNAQLRMSELSDRFANARGVEDRAVKQAGRELLLAQSSDWPFILRTGTSPDYARSRFNRHLLTFLQLHDQIINHRIDEAALARLESQDDLFPELDFRYWRPTGG